VIKVKRVYEEPAEDDGIRILVERLWPRELGKEKAKLYLWLRDVAPSNELKKWYSNDIKKWGAFKKKYFDELNIKKDSLKQIVELLNQNKTITFLFSSKEEIYNSSVALREYIYKFIANK
jgi:uncharacterized protein YeaO (DUF488 family)